LRGTAALSVLALHLCEVFRPTGPGNPLHHAYLAVDFFYMLSGFVMGHAYDRRWRRMSLASFFGQRLRRLHPLVLLGVGLGLISQVAGVLWLGQPAAPAGLLALDALLAALLVPAPSLPGRDGLTYALNGPSWSLGQEYLANLAYALVLRRIGRGALAALVLAAGAGLILIAARHGTLHLGWGWETRWLAPARTAFPFLAGLLLQRLGARLTLPLGWTGLSVLLLAAFAAPTLPDARANGLFEAALVIGLFPLVIVAGATSPARGRLAGLCRLCGEISYPLYMIHWPVVRLYADWVWTGDAPHGPALALGAALALGLPLAAWATARLYDEPVRAWLGGRRRGPAQPDLAAATSPASSR
jgi:peptidoglycan/LPS O-acetylase OafA/YrhL